MKTKFLRKLRKRFEIKQEDDLYYLVDNESLHWDDTYPYKYTRRDNLNKVRSERSF